MKGGVELTGDNALTFQEARALRRKLTITIDGRESFWAGIGRKLDAAMAAVDPGQVMADRLGATSPLQDSEGEK